MTRVGKIARLPRPIREQLNQRLENGESGVELVAWLNGQRKVQSVMKARFGGRSISEQNLSEWKQGGYIEWQAHQESLDFARELAANADELNKEAGDSLADTISPLLAGRYAAMLKAASSINGQTADDWKLLRELCSDVVALRKGDHSAARLALDRDRLRWR
jgi:hypothetical protein